MSFEKIILLHEVIRKALALKQQGNYAVAISLISEFLSQELSPELQSEALGYMASFKEDSGDYEGAKKDLLSALSMCPMLSYAQYTLELNLGGISEKFGMREDAVLWYMKALATAVKGEDFSGGTALFNLLRLRDKDMLTEQEKILCSQVAQKSWKVLMLHGEPDLSYLQRVAEILIKTGGEAKNKEKDR